jgi:hypothetical protein
MYQLIEIGNMIYIQRKLKVGVGGDKQEKNTKCSYVRFFYKFFLFLYSKMESSTMNWNNELPISPTSNPIVLEPLEPYNNIYMNPRRTYFTNSDKEFIRTLRDESHRICREEINPDYIKKVFKKFKEGFLYNDEIGRRLAFCIWKVNEHPRKDGYGSDYILNLLLICSKHKELKLSQTMFHDLESYCMTNRIAQIELEAVNSKVEELYKTFGFISMPKVIEGNNTVKMVKGVYVRKLRKKTETNKSYSSLRLTRKKPKDIGGDHVT